MSGKDDGIHPQVVPKLHPDGIFWHLLTSIKNSINTSIFNKSLYSDRLG